MTGRIRWEDGIGGRLNGYAGTLPGSAFCLWPPTFSEEWTLTSALPGQGEGRAVGYDPDPAELKARAEKLLAEFAASLGAVFPAAPGERQAAFGPFDTEQDVLGLPAVAAAYDAARATTRRGVLAERGHRLLCEAVTSAGVEPGTYDHAIMTWLARFGPQYCAVVAGLVTRAYEAGRAGQ